MTRDHVVPTSMLEKSDTTNFTVPACLNCNNGKSQLDPIVRFFSAVTPGSNAPPKIVDLSISSLSHIYKNVLPILESHHPSEYTSPNGLNHGEHVAFEVPGSFKMGIVMMVMGFHYHLTKQRLLIHSIKSFDTNLPSQQDVIYSLDRDDVACDDVTIGQGNTVVHARNRYLIRDRSFGLWEITLYGDATCYISTSGTF